MGIGGAAFLAVMAANNAKGSSGPSWCQKNRCKCPCHRDRWYDSFWFWLLATLFGSALFMWLLITTITWVDPDTHLTLVKVLKDEWRGLVELVHRIY